MHRSVVRFRYSRELKLGTAEFLQRHPVCRKFSFGKLSLRMAFDFDSLLVTEFYLPRTSPTKTAPFVENSHRIAFDPPIMTPFAYDGRASATSDRKY